MYKGRVLFSLGLHFLCEVNGERRSSCKYNFFIIEEKIFLPHIGDSVNFLFFPKASYNLPAKVTAVYHSCGSGKVASSLEDGIFADARNACDACVVIKFEFPDEDELVKLVPLLLADSWKQIPE